MTLALPTRLGPYEIVAPLGAGGMGEVYRARDTRLGRDVAIKVLPAAFASDPERLRRFEQEARAASALDHPNILVVHDIGTHDGSPYLVTELLEGTSLRDLLIAKNLTPRKAVELAVQIAEGLAAAHAKGIIHRDLKPENLFLTSGGRVKILDFGVAKLTRPEAGNGTTAATPGPSTETGAVLGTVGYMAPEQVRGLPCDQRADIFAFGCVLYEMLSGRRAFTGATAADTMSAILHEDPSPISAVVAPSSSALDGIVRRCLEKRPEDRFTSARDLAFALQAVAETAPREAVPPPEEPRPYPGLAAFTEADAEHFFGREGEVAEMWERIPGRRMQALIGPSGAGKTSFLRAGLVPAAPEGWRCLVCTPGAAPLKGLARALVPELSGDLAATQRLVDFDEPDVSVGVIAGWRRRHDEALLVVDQLEELFTLNPPEVQAAFAALLGRIASEAGVHVLLSMRDDFFFECAVHSALRETFTATTPLLPPEGQALRRALVRPAEAHGVAFEDEALIQEILRSVEGERGALPMLAFTMARLWELRDLEGKRLTRAAYGRIGGVAGALAQHAEAVIEGIGSERELIVRELFRSLVTAQGTRTVVEVDELLSVFPEEQRADTGRVLGTLVAARLLTRFELEGAVPNEAVHPRVEIVHESLLQSWPRLVRWQVQDAEGALLRDHLRKAAHLWVEKGRPEDLLWAGNSFREYKVWRERYTGGLSEVEEAFAGAMVELAGRRRRRRRIAYVAVLAAVVLVATGLGLMWRRSAEQTRRAEAEAAQREAAQLLALGRLRLADHPNASLAYAIASLERANSEPARRFAVEAVWQGPSALFLSDPRKPHCLDWSRDNRWLVLGGNSGLVIFDASSGSRHELSSFLELPGSPGLETLGFSADGRLVTKASRGAPTVLHVWAPPEWTLERTVRIADSSWVWLADNGLVAFSPDFSAPPERRPEAVRRLLLDGSVKEELGSWIPHVEQRERAVDLKGTRVLSIRGKQLVEQRLDRLSDPPRVIGRCAADANVWLRPWSDRAVTGDSAGNILVWDAPAARLERTLKSPVDARLIALDPTGRFLASAPAGPAGQVSRFLFDLAASRTAEPEPLLGSKQSWVNGLKFSPDGSWLASIGNGDAALWNTRGPRSLILGRQKPSFVTVAFTGDGHVLSTSDEGVLRRWPISFAAGEAMRVLWSQSGAAIGGFLEVAPGGRRVVLAERIGQRVLTVSPDGSDVWSHLVEAPAGLGITLPFSSLAPTGDLLATWVYTQGRPQFNSIRVVNLRTGQERTFDTHPKGGDRCEIAGSNLDGIAVPTWLPDGRLVTDGDAGLRLWDLVRGTSHLLRRCAKAPPNGFLLLADPRGSSIVRLDPADQADLFSRLTVFELASGVTREITTHSNRIEAFAIDPSGTMLVTGDNNGVIRVGPLSGEEPHLLFGHTAAVMSVAVSPDGRTIASGSDDGTIRLWPMPDLSNPPLHTLPHDELLVKLKALTNLRAVRDPASDTGWRIDVGPFPGWASVPEWQP